MTHHKIFAVVLAVWGATYGVAAAIQLFQGEPTEWRPAVGLLLIYAAELRWKGTIS